jgi:hypothetical protein
MDVFKKYNVMLGSDPELLLNKKMHGITLPFPIVGLLGHGKKNPLHIDDSGFRTLQEDNVALEYTTHPVSTLNDWLKEQAKMYKIATQFARSVKLIPETHTTSLNFNRIALHSKQAEEFGCEASWNCYKNKENEMRRNTSTMRSAGGHIHISYDGHTRESSMELVKILDLLLVSSEYRSISTMGESIRRKFYGTPGEARLKSYGVEWRTPSSGWIHTESNREKVWNLVHKAFELWDEGLRVKPDNLDEIGSRILSNTSMRTPILKSLYKITPPAPIKKSRKIIKEKELTF